MKSTNNGSFTERSDRGPADGGRLLSADELALPAVCGQTGRPFLMVVRRQGREVLEIVRAIPIGSPPALANVPARQDDSPPRNRVRDVSLAVLRRGAGPENQYASYKPLDLSARIELGDRYDGCPYCRARGYFHCSKCGLFSCWNSHNRKHHLDHSDIWCEGCRLWRCTRDKDEGHDSLSKMTAYAAGEPKTGGGRRAAIESTARDQISRSTPLRGYLE
jgi:hypothetical protein